MFTDPHPNAVARLRRAAATLLVVSVTAALVTAPAASAVGERVSAPASDSADGGATVALDAVDRPHRSAAAPPGGGNSGDASGAGKGTDNGGRDSGDTSGAGKGTDKGGRDSGDTSGSSDTSNTGEGSGNSGSDSDSNTDDGNGNSSGASDSNTDDGNGNSGSASDSSKHEKGDESEGNGNGDSGGSSASGREQGNDTRRDGTRGPPADRGNAGRAAEKRSNGTASNRTGRGPPEDVSADGSARASNRSRRGSPDNVPPTARSNGTRRRADATPAVAVRAGPSADRRWRGGRDAVPGRGDNRSVVSVGVSNVEAGDHVSVNVTHESTRSDFAAFDEIETTVRRGGNFSMTVRASESRLPGSPEFEVDSAAESLARVRLEHSISNAEVDDVSYTFRVSKAQLRASGAAPERVVMYRYEDGEWSALPTDLVEETATHLRFRADSPGMSEFAIAVEKPKFDLYRVDLNRSSVRPGERVEVTGRVTNVGHADGAYTASLVVDGRSIAFRDVTVAARGTRQVTFTTSFDRPGTHVIHVDGRPAGTVVVRGETAESGRPASRTSLPLVSRLLQRATPPNVRVLAGLLDGRAPLATPPPWPDWLTP